MRVPSSICFATGLCLVVLFGCAQPAQERYSSAPYEKTRCRLDGDQLADLQSIASGGGSDAKYALGELYWFGNCVEQDVIKAIEHFQDAAARGNARAMVRLGGLYRVGFEPGRGIDKDESQAIRWYVKAGEIESACEVDSVRCAVEIESAAHRGNVDAQYELANRYLDGRVLENDLTLGMSWLEKAANGGHRDAQFDLGYIRRQQVQWDEPSADADRWFSISSSLGNASATNWICRTGTGMTQAHCKSKIARYIAQYWVPSIETWATDGHVDAQNLLGEMYRDGIGVAVDKKTAIQWFQTAANAGSMRAAVNLCDTNWRCRRARSRRAQPDFGLRHLAAIPLLMIPGIGPLLMMGLMAE